MDIEVASILLSVTIIKLVARVHCSTQLLVAVTFLISVKEQSVFSTSIRNQIVVYNEEAIHYARGDFLLKYLPVIQPIHAPRVPPTSTSSG